MKKNTILIMAAALAVSLTLTGCAPKQSPVGITGASRADGTVTVGYRMANIWGGLEHVTPTFTGGEQKAVTACQKWGYSNASELDNNAFGYSCQQYDPLAGCMAATFTKVYQCEGNQPGSVHK